MKMELVRQKIDKNFKDKDGMGYLHHAAQFN